MATVIVQYRNATPIEVDAESVTARKARAGQGNWKLISGEAAEKVKEEAEKKSESADASVAASEAEEVKSESADALPTAPAPTPKNKGGRKKKENK